MFAGNLEKDKEIKSPLLIPREFDIKPSSHPRGGKTSTSTYSALGGSTYPIYYLPFRVSRVLAGVVEGEEYSPRYSAITAHAADGSEIVAVAEATEQGEAWSIVFVCLCVRFSSFSPCISFMLLY